jgi:hypothetical protein
MEPARFDERGDIKEGAPLATRRTSFPAQNPQSGDDLYGQRAL